MATMEGKIYPGEIFLVRGRDGKGHCYLQDPMKIRNRNELEVDFTDTMFGFFGESNAVNPMVLHVSGVVFSRGEAFDISMPAKVRTGSYDGHFEDSDGNVVEVLPMRSPDPLFPVNGIVLTRGGRLVEQRLYDGTGRCADGNADHALYVVNGPLKEESVEEGGKEEEL